MVVRLERGADDLHYGPADATVTSRSLALLKFRMVYPFWCRLTQVVLEMRSLNGCLITRLSLSAVLTRPLSLHSVIEFSILTHTTLVD